MKELTEKQKRILRKAAADAMVPYYSGKQEFGSVLSGIYLDAFGREVKQEAQGDLMAEEICGGVHRFRQIYHDADVMEREELLRKLEKGILPEGTGEGADGETDPDVEVFREAVEDTEKQIRASFLEEMEEQERLGQEGALNVSVKECLFTGEPDEYEKEIAVLSMLLYCKIKTRDPDFAAFPLFLTAEQVVAIVYTAAEKERLTQEQRAKEISSPAVKGILGTLAVAAGAVFVGSGTALLLFGVAGTVKLAQSVWGKKESSAQESQTDMQQQAQMETDTEEVAAGCEEVIAEDEEKQIGAESETVLLTEE